ncbi:MAG TPA: dUTPase [Planctomycetota bacterium]|nr:dUTPase [Planctomycetota bacterium]
MDKLNEIFSLQSSLNDGIFKKQDIRAPDGQVLTMSAIHAALERGELGPNGLPNQWLRNYLRALQDECAELDRDLLWKWWSKDKIDLQNARVEIVDMLHFLVSLALTAGLTADEFHRLYMAKHEVNQKRQESGYSKENKNEAENRRIV